MALKGRRDGEEEGEVERELIGSFEFTGDKIASSHSGKKYEVLDMGILNPEETPTALLTAGQVGYVGESSTRRATPSSSLSSRAASLRLVRFQSAT